MPPKSLSETEPSATATTTATTAETATENLPSAAEPITADKPLSAAKHEKGEKKDENPIRNYFVHLFGKINFRNEAQFLNFGRWLVFLGLIAVEIGMLLQHIGNYKNQDGWVGLVIHCSLIFLLTVSEAVQLFAVRGKARFVFYTIDAVVACCFLFFSDGVYPLVVYMLALTQFYIGAEKFRFSVIVFGVSLPLYAIIYGAHGNLLKLGSEGFFRIVTQGLGAVVAITIHFFAVHIALAFYRQYLKLNKAVHDLNESRSQLQKAYEAVAEVTALEERQRIAKEIHDTAGHSITTVIMQTESAKRIIESNPDEAKSKIVAANLQARHALEELRDSVHLLSGRTEKQTLKTSLESIINESTDGTGIVIRSSVDDVAVSSAKYRFLCNSLKEGISNGLRHGGATAFWFELKVTDKIEFLLSDNGEGMDEAFLQLGFGLTTMQERAKALGGTAEIKTEKGEGFELCLTLPLDKEE